MPEPKSTISTEEIVFPTEMVTFAEAFFHL
jgi:hypothetical protein